MKRSGVKLEYIILWLTGILTMFIFSLPVWLYFRHESVVELESLIGRCPAGASEVGCMICARKSHQMSSKEAGILGGSGTLESTRGALVYHHKALRTFMYQFGLSTVLDVGCGLSPDFLMQLHMEIPCLRYMGTEESIKNNELRSFENMFDARAAKERGGVKSARSWASFQVADITSRDTLSLPPQRMLPREVDLVYYHRPLDLDSPEVRARSLGSLCRAKPRYLLMKDGSRTNAFFREPEASIREKNLRGMDRHFLLHDAAALCFSPEFGKYLEAIPRSTRATLPMVGEYEDIAHPGVSRHMTPSAVADVLLVSGLDGGGWILPGWVNSLGSRDLALTVDFSHKGGPSQLHGIYDEVNNSIRWADGNVWKKKS